MNNVEALDYAIRTMSYAEESEMSPERVEVIEHLKELRARLANGEAG